MTELSPSPAARAGQAVPRHDERADRRQANRAVTVSAIGLALTGGIELALALVTGSVALLGDAIHNLADVSTSGVVFLAFFISKRKPSTAYTYGYERAEDLAGLGVALVIWLSAAFVGWQSYEKLVNKTGTNYVAVGLAAAVIGMVGNYAVSRYKMHVALKIQSATMKVEAKHSWLDVLSSVGAFIGLLGVGLGYRWADPIAGFAVTLFILHVGYEVTHDIAQRLMDGVEPASIAAAKESLRGVPGLRAATVRGRWMGRSLILEVEGELDGQTPLAQADVVGRAVETAVREAVKEVRQVRWIARSHPA